MLTLAFYSYPRESPRYGAGSETPMHPSRTPMHHPAYMTPMRDPNFGILTSPSCVISYYNLLFPCRWDIFDWGQMINVKGDFGNCHRLSLMQLILINASQLLLVTMAWGPQCVTEHGILILQWLRIGTSISFLLAHVCSSLPNFLLTTGICDSTSWPMFKIVLTSLCLYCFCRSNTWDDANPSTWDTHTSTPQFEVCHQS